MSLLRPMRRAAARGRDLLADRRGAAAAELALVFPLIALALMGSYDLALGFAASLLVAMVTRVTHGHSGRPLAMVPLAWLARHESIDGRADFGFDRIDPVELVAAVALAVAAVYLLV